MTIICIKMKTGEDVIADVSSSLLVGSADPLKETPPRMPKGDVTIKDPRVITLQEVPGNRMALALVPYLMGDHEASMVFDDLRDAAVGVYAPRPEIEKSYLQQTSNLDLSALGTAGKIKN